MQTQRNEQDELATLPEETETEGASTQEGTPDSEGNEGGVDSGAAVVEIDGHKFDSEASALKWALENKSQLEREKDLAEAYRSGISDAQTFSPGTPLNQQAPKQEDEDPNFEERFYANPKEVLRELKTKIKQEAFADFQRATSARDIEREVWDKFSSSYPDLADFKEDVETIANHPEHKDVIQALVRTKGQETAMSYVAQKTRAKFQAYVEATKQKTVLPSGANRGLTPSGAGKSVTLPKKEDKPLSMREQLRQHKARFQRKSE